MRRYVPSPRILAPCTPALYREATTTSGRVQKPSGKVNFDDRSTYKEKSIVELIKALVVLKICSIDYFARNSVVLMKRSERILGKGLTYQFFVKRTIYSHFCAGENDQEVRDTVHRLDSVGIGAVLDYAAEADTTEGFAPLPGQAQAPDLSLASLVKKSNVAYTLPEATFEENMKLYMMSIMHASLHCPVGSHGVAAVKVTGMCDPQLLARVSSILMHTHQCWSRFFAKEEVPKFEECRMVTGVKQSHKVSVSTDEVRKGWQLCRETGRQLSEAELSQIINTLDPAKKGNVTYFRFKEILIDAILAQNPTPDQKLLASLMPEVSATEKELWAHVCRRLSLIASTAKELQVRMLVDAEQTFYQLAIDLIVGQLQVKYNKELPVVYNTYQCYLTYAEDRVYNDLQRAEYLGFHWGGKVVRGAYMVQERKTAEEYNYTSPIWPTIEDTAKCYEDTAARAMKTIEEHPERKHEVFFGTHNRQSLERITEQVLTHVNLHDRVAFGQLFGMRDNLTIPLAKAGYVAYKYVPYGPVRETIHYLGRRAVENASILSSGDSEETRLMKKEIFGRLTLSSPRS